MLVGQPMQIALGEENAIKLVSLEELVLHKHVLDSLLFVQRLESKLDNQQVSTKLLRSAYESSLHLLEAFVV